MASVYELVVSTKRAVTAWTWTQKRLNLRPCLTDERPIVNWSQMVTKSHSEEWPYVDMTWEQILSTEEFTNTEKKTGKRRTLRLNIQLQQHIQ